MGNYNTNKKKLINFQVKILKKDYKSKQQMDRLIFMEMDQRSF